MDGGPEPPPSTHAPGRAQRPAGRRVARALSLPISLVDRYAELGEPPYYLVRRDDGSVLAGDTGDLAEPPDEEVYGPRDHVSRQRGRLREVILRGPNATRILVGRPIGRELDRLHRMGWQLALTGLTVFGVGLVGGWWLSSRAIRPIAGRSARPWRASPRRTSPSGSTSRGSTPSSAGSAACSTTCSTGLESSFEQQSRFTADASTQRARRSRVILTHGSLPCLRPRQAEGYRERWRPAGAPQAG
ncbi:MAG: hypothetical protein U0835_20285 [Isosphaeraceae bacterium]